MEKAEVMPIEPVQVTAINTCIAKLKLLSQKQNIIEGATNGRSKSTKELHKHEARELLMQLNKMIADQDGNSEKRKKMIGKIFYYAHEIGWQKTNDKGKVVADGKKVDEWMVKYSYLKKKLNYYRYEELPKLVSQFEMFYKSFLKGI